MRVLPTRSLRGSDKSAARHGSTKEPSRPRWSSAGTRYDVLDRAGEGTLFVVYRVREKDTGRILALKALKGAFSRHLQFAPAIGQAAVKVANLTHPHLAVIEEVGEEEGTLFIVGEWLPGQSLEARLRRAPFGRIEALTSTRQIAEALQYLHSNGVTHGDLRPRQILGAGNGHLKLTDVGNANAFVAAGMSIAEIAHDSIYYLSPERTEAGLQSDVPATPASDLYALGVILYRMLSGRVPFTGPSPVAVALRHRNDAPLRPSQFNPECPADLEEIALKLLAKNPAERFASAAEVLEALNPSSRPQVSVPEIEPVTAAVPPVQPAVSNSGLQSPSPSIETQPLPAEELFPASLPLSALAAAKIPDGPIAAPLVTTPAVASATGAVTAGIAAAATATGIVPSVVAGSMAAPAAGDIGAAADVAAPVATPTATSASGATMDAAVAPTSDSAATAPALPKRKKKDKALAAASVATAFDADAERKARRKQRRREGLGAFLAFFWLLVAIGLLGGIVYGAYYSWIKSAPRDVRVPNYVGKSQTQAEQILMRSGLKMTVRSEVYDPKRPAGTVTTGLPPVGKLVKEGRTVEVTVSRGEEQIVMPDLTELDVQRVRQILSRGGMRLGNISEMYHDRIARGYICGQYPTPGAQFSRSEPINLIISRGPQPQDRIQATSPLPPPPPRSSFSSPDSPLSAQPNDGSTTDANGTPLVSRTVLVRIPVPVKGNSTSHRVRIVVKDQDGTQTVYDQTHAPGELVDEYVQVTRAQGTTATLSIYIDNELQKQQKV